MKKFLKVFIIVLLVLASVCVTCYFFFKNLKEKENTTASIAEILYAESKTKFNNDLQAMSSLINSDGTDNRLELIIETNLNLDEITKVLASYYIESDTKINNERIAKVYQQLNASRNLLNAMIAEYNIKKDSAYFNRHLGANDFYAETCVYLLNYAKLANYINSSLNFNKTTDLKFSMFDIYTNVVINAFNKTKEVSSRLVIDNDANINKINDIFVMRDSIISTSVQPFAKEINIFNNAYYNCNKTEFATNLASNITIVTSSNQDTNEKIATYYFKQIFKI